MGIGYIPPRDSEGNAITRASNVQVDEKRRVRHKGIFDVSVAASSSGDFDWQVEQLQYNGSNVPSIMVGVRYRSSADGKIDFCVGDKDGVMVGLLYDQATFDALKIAGGGFVALDQFSDEFFIFKNEVGEIREHKADLIAGLYIRAHIENLDATNALEFKGNLLRYIDTSGV